MQSLTQKEKMLLQDQAKHEEICIQKYSKYASQAKDQELRNMFNEFAKDEQEHYNTIQGFLTNPQGAQRPGNQPQSQQYQSPRQATSMQAGGPELGQTTSQIGWANRGFTAEAGQIGGGAGSGTQDEASMLTDMLMTEKYVSGAYDTAVFESSNKQLRQALQHIQQDEQRHGEGIFNYMQQRGLYKQS